MAPAALFSTKDLAKFVGVSIETIQTYVDRGIVKPDFEKPKDSLGRSGGLFFTQETVDAFLSSCSTGTYNTHERLLSTGEVAELLELNIKTVRILVQKGRLKPDIVLPSGRDGRSGAMKFYISNAKEFACHYVKRERVKHE